ncbi:MAG: phospholipase D-like domain-containing protein [Nanoarchaeota archaeon]|nr:phospholipase D-like domain-containing protein [Nanoarchaeota archaeon]
MFRNNVLFKNNRSGKISKYVIILAVIVLVIVVVIFFYAMYLEKKAYRPPVETTHSNDADIADAGANAVTGVMIGKTAGTSEKNSSASVSAIVPENKQNASQVPNRIPSESLQVPTENTGGSINQELELYFCPKENCEQVFISKIQKATKARCALYDLDSKGLIAAFKAMQDKGQLTLLLEKDNMKDAKEAKLVFSSDKNSNLMHHKFCVLDDQFIITGSTNPTNNDFNKNNNNMFIIESKTLAANYDKELDYLFESAYSKERTQTTEVVINGNTYRNYFCPRDSCREHVLAELKYAQESIHFMTFSFTDNSIGDLIVQKHNAGLNVSGVMERKQIDDWSEYRKLKRNGVNVLIDGNKYNLHDKVFIIDGKTVITGSYNPTDSGTKRNNENILVINNAAVAKRFISEFNYIYDEATRMNISLTDD